MNKKRLKEINVIVDTLEVTVTELEGIRDEEEEAKDAMPEPMQSGVSGERADAAMDGLAEAKDKVQEAIDALQEAVEHLQGIE